jgi:hypothetical protein
MAAELLRHIVGDPALLEIGRKAIEDTLVEWRDARLSELMRGNGLVIRDANGEASSIIRFGPEMAVRIALGAIADHLDACGVRPAGVAEAPATYPSGCTHPNCRCPVYSNGPVCQHVTGVNLPDGAKR